MSMLERTVEDIKNMKIRSARGIAVASLNILKRIAEKEGFGKSFRKASNGLVNARPTAVALYNAIKTVEQKKSLEEIDKMIFYFKNIGDVIGFLNYKIVKNNSTLLTHCHSGTVVDFLKAAKKKKRKFKVIVTETRPRWQGDITSKELVSFGIPVIYIVDSAAGFFAKDIDAMIFGCDAIRKEGVVNKIGSYLLAVFAKENKIPVYFAGGIMKLDRRKKFKIEERSPKEVTRRRETKKFDVRNPAFDITPWKFVRGVITEKGVLKPRQVLRMLR